MAATMSASLFVQNLAGSVSTPGMQSAGLPLFSMTKYVTMEGNISGEDWPQLMCVETHRDLLAAAVYNIGFGTLLCEYQAMLHNCSVFQFANDLWSPHLGGCRKHGISDAVQGYNLQELGRSGNVSKFPWFDRDMVVYCQAEDEKNCAFIETCEDTAK